MTHPLRLLLVFLVAALTGCGDVVGDIFSGTTAVRNPIWSPDGKQVVFHLKGEDCSSEFYVVDSDGRGLQRLKGLEPDSPERQMASRVFKRDRDEGRSGVARLRRIGVRTTGRWPGGAPKKLVFVVVWSPDGQWIAYSYRSPGRTSQDVYVVRSDGSSKPRMVARHADYPTFSPDSQLLALSRGLEMFVAPVSGGRLRRLPIEPRTEPGLGDLALSPDGTRIAYTTTAALYVAEIETGSVRRLADTGDACG